MFKDYKKKSHDHSQNEYNSGSFTYRSSRVQDLKTRLLLNSNVLFIPEPNKNTIVFIISFNNYNFSSGTFQQPPPFLRVAGHSQ